MTLSRSTILAAMLALTAALPGQAVAQGFFERLFGLRPAPVPPASVPQNARPLPPPPPGVPGVPPSDWGPGGGPSGPPQSAGPTPARPVAMKPPSEEGVLGRDLKLNGTLGLLRIDRGGQGALRAQVTLAGARVSQPTESCSVKLAGEPIPLTSSGKADGLPRYELQAPMCSMVLDVVDGAVMVTKPEEACVIQEADCRAEPRGLWGPEPTALIPKASDFEQARGNADRAVRENYKALTQRASPQTVRPIVSEQAAFSSEREELCRSYSREGVHGFCNARFTEARAVTLASRLGLLAPPPEAQAERPRRPRPAPLTEVAPPSGDSSLVR